MRQKALLFISLLISTSGFLTAQKVSVFEEGFTTPVGLQVSADGSLWLTQTGTGNDDGKVSVITPDGAVHDVVTGLPSLLNATTGEIVGAWRTYQLADNRLLVVSGEGEHDLAGSLLTYDLTGFTPGDAPMALEDYEAVFNIDDFSLAMGAENSNPYSVAWNTAGEMFIIDAGANALLRRDPVTNDLSIFASFPDIPNPTPIGPPAIDFVPTKVISDGADGFYVANLSGFPFLNGLANVTHVDAAGDTTLVASGLTLLVDIAVDPTDGNLVVLQFGEFVLGPVGFQPASARLVKLYPNGSQFVMARGFGPSAGLAFAANGDAYVSSIFTGEVLKIAFVAPDNDNLCNATPLTIGSTDTSPNIYPGFATTEPNEPYFSCVAGAVYDSITNHSVWFSFVAPENDVYLLAAPDEPTVRSSYYMSVFTLDGACTDLSNLIEIACSTPEQNLFSSPSLLLSDLIAGETYYVQVSGRRFSEESGIIELPFSNPGWMSVIEVSPPANDEACNAITLALNAETQTFSNIGATSASGEAAIAPGPGLSGPIAVTNDGWALFATSIEHSVWFTFTTPPTGGNTTVNLLNSFALPGNLNTQLAVYKVGDCSDFSTYELVGASDNYIPPGAGLLGINSSLDQLCLEGNTTYYVLIDGSPTFLGAIVPDQGYFSIDIQLDTNAQTVIDTTLLADGMYNGEVYTADTTLLETFIGSNGCDSLVLTNISVLSTGVRETWAADAILISPNPTAGQLNIKTTDITEKDLNLCVRDLYGRILYIKPLQAGDANLDVSTLAPGHYLLEIRSAEKFAVRRFVKL